MRKIILSFYFCSLIYTTEAKASFGSGYASDFGCNAGGYLVLPIVQMLLFGPWSLLLLFPIHLIIIKKIIGSLTIRSVVKCLAYLLFCGYVSGIIVHLTTCITNIIQPLLRRPFLFILVHFLLSMTLYIFILFPRRRN